MTDVSEIVAAVRADVRGRLLDLLDEERGKLCTTWAHVGPLDLVVSPSDLKDHGVQQWFKLSDQPVASDCAQMVFLVRCERVDLIEMIANQILADEKEQKDRLYVVVFVPEKTEQCKQRLAQHHVKANVRIAECAIHHFPSDKDVLSMETPRMFQRLHCENDPSGPYYAARGIMSLQETFGTIPTVRAIGLAGKIVVDTIQRLRKENQAGQSKKKPGDAANRQPGVPPVAVYSKGAAAMRRKEDGRETGIAAEVESAGDKSSISEMVVIDRRVDLFSVLCSQFTYQALIDFAYGIQNNSIDISSASWAKDIRAAFEAQNRDEITAQSTSSTSCLETVQAIMDDQKPFHEALRLLCLHSLVNNGIKKQQLDPLKTAFKQSYGFEHTLTLENMESAGLLRPQIGKSGWGSIKRQFNLFVEDDLADRDVSYAYSGYAPLSVRLVQMTRTPMGLVEG
eukprot:g10079.t1